MEYRIYIPMKGYASYAIRADSFEEAMKGIQDSDTDAYFVPEYHMELEWSKATTEMPEFVKEYDCAGV